MSAQSLIVLGMDQLVPTQQLRRLGRGPVFLCEDAARLADLPYHRHRLIFILAALRQYGDQLRNGGRTVDYHAIDDGTGRSWEERLRDSLDHFACRRISALRPAGRGRQQALEEFCAAQGIALDLYDTPQFLCSDGDCRDWAASQQRRLQMQHFWPWLRRRQDLLIERDGRPTGGRWSFDADNRQSLPGDVQVPDFPDLQHGRRVQEVQRLVAELFPDQPGDVAEFWLPTTRKDAMRYLRHVVEHRLDSFGDYQDALDDRHPVLFHSLLSPLLNVGLLLPQEVVDRVLKRHALDPVPINSLEGFLRQVAGWREFVRLVDLVHGDEQESGNHWRHRRGLAASWWRADTGIPPLDETITKVRRWGYAHHIERLMVLGNMMLLAEIHPKQVYDWFMAMFIDSTDWVMGPNVYGMALRSDGGVMTTKPYICSSNYLCNMGHWQRGPWCDVVDGLYWRFVHEKRDDLRRNPRLAVMVGTLDRMDSERRERLLAAAEGWLDEHTTQTHSRLRRTPAVLTGA